MIERAGDFFLTDSGTASGAWAEAAGLRASTPSSRGDDAAAASSTSAAEEEAAALGFKHVAGIVSSAEKDKLARIVFRASSGHAVVRYADIPGELLDEAGTPQAKTVFAIFYRGRSLAPKLDRICTAFGAHQHDIPNFGHEGEVAAALEETKVAIADAIGWLQQERATTSSVLRHLALLLARWKGGVSREKAVLHALNLAERAPERGTLTAHGWVLKSTVGAVRDALAGVHTAAAQGGRVQPFFFEVLFAPTASGAAPPPGVPKPPTHFHVNRLTRVFQGIVNTYGMPRYGEANPALWSIATFPFLFGVMYGDIGHGTLLFLAALWMLLREKELLASPQSEIFGMAFKGRYMLVMMGAFSVYCGFLYNDFFATGTNLFGTRWQYRAVNGTAQHEATFAGGSANDVYPFGMDPEWRRSDNELLMFNSLKMKMSIIMGITQMTFGLVLKLGNALYFKSAVDLWCEAVPQLVFMIAMFGYMVFLILFKWSVDWRAKPSPGAPPSLIDVMINLVLKPGTVTDPMYPGQAGLQQLILLVVFFCVPVMLLAKPLILNRANKKAAKARAAHAEDAHAEDHGLVGGKAGGAAGGGGGHGHGGHEEEHGFGELFIHQAIETIEFVLGSVSNTASYLRLWALSLAHSQLADVFWTRALIAQVELAGPAEDGSAPSAYAWVFIVIGFGAWTALTVAVLMCMDVLECFLHALRLHWVEFQVRRRGARGRRGRAVAGGGCVACVRQLRASAAAAASLPCFPRRLGAPVRASARSLGPSPLTRPRVPLQNKFFKADGYKFAPFSFVAIAQAEAEAAAAAVASK